MVTADQAEALGAADRRRDPVHASRPARARLGRDRPPAVRGSCAERAPSRHQASARPQEPGWASAGHVCRRRPRAALATISCQSLFRVAEISRNPASAWRWSRTSRAPWASRGSSYSLHPEAGGLQRADPGLAHRPVRVRVTSRGGCLQLGSFTGGSILLSGNGARGQSLAPVEI